MLETCSKFAPLLREHCTHLSYTIRIAHYTLTHIGKVIDEDDLLDEMLWRSIQNRVYGSQQHGPRLVVEADNDSCRRQIFHVTTRLLAPGDKNEMTISNASYKYKPWINK